MIEGKALLLGSHFYVSLFQTMNTEGGSLIGVIGDEVRRNQFLVIFFFIPVPL
jgi:hypothetical protein